MSEGLQKREHISIGRGGGILNGIDQPEACSSLKQSWLVVVKLWVTWNIYLISLWFPSMCHKANGPLKQYTALGVIDSHLMAMPSGSVLCMDSRTLLWGTLMPRKLKWNSTLLYPAFGNSVWILRKTESTSWSDISVRVPRIEILNSRSHLLMVLTLTPRASAKSGVFSLYSTKYSSWSLLISNLGRPNDPVERTTKDTGCQFRSASSKADVISARNNWTSSNTFPVALAAILDKWRATCCNRYNT